MRYELQRLEPRRLCAAGDHDLTYGDGGFVRLQLGQTPYQFLPDSDPLGEAAIVSTSPDGASIQIRHFNAGMPDDAAGPGGVEAIVPLPFRGRNGVLPEPKRVWNLSDGRTLIEFAVQQADQRARFSRDGYIVRLNPDRSLDRSFGDGGAIFFPGRFPFEVVQQGDALIAIAGTDVHRYTPDLIVDEMFGDGGLVRGIPAFHILLQPDNKVLVASHSARVYRLTTDGELDTAFGGGDGLAGGAPGIDGFDLGLDDAGRIIMYAPRTARLTPDGALDPTFGTGGVSELLPRSLWPGSLIMPGGVVVGGKARGAEIDRIGRLDDNGNVDDAFGVVAFDLWRTEGEFDDNLPADVQTVTEQPDGSILIGRRFNDGRFVQFRIEGGGGTAGRIVSAGPTVKGTAGDDEIAFVGSSDDHTTALLNGVGRTFDENGGDTWVADGNGGNDTIVVEGVASPAVFAGGEGDDRIVGGAQDDTLFGNAGNDRIDGGTGHDFIHGYGGNDRLAGGPGNDRIFGDAGNDRLAGESAGDILDGGTGNDFLDGGEGADRIMGSDGNDTFVSDGDFNVVDDLYGGGGTDTLLAGDDDDLLTSIETT